MRRLLALGLLLPLAAACAGPGGEPMALGCDGVLRVANAAPQTVEQLFVSAAGPRGWGPDRLAPGTLPPGGQHAARTSDGRVQSVRVVFVDGSAVEIRDLDVCATPRLTIGAGGLQAGG